MPTEQKTETVNDLSQQMTAAKSIVLADFTGLDVASVTQLRRSLRSASVDYRVVKNRLAKRAASDAGLSSLEEFFSGPTAMAFGLDDPLEPARVLQKFVDTGGKIAIKSGFMDGQVLSPEQIKDLASLPSRSERSPRGRRMGVRGAARVPESRNMPGMLLVMSLPIFTVIGGP